MRINTKCSIAIHCLLFVHEYGEKKKVTSELLALSTGCNPVVIRGIVSALKKDGILTAPSGAGGARLSCPAQDITLYRVCMALEPDAMRKLIGFHPLPSVLCPIGQRIHEVLDTSYEKVREDMKRSLQSVTLEDFINEYRNCGAKGGNQIG